MAEAVGELSAALLRYPGGAGTAVRRPSGWTAWSRSSGFELSEGELAALLPLPWMSGGPTVGDGLSPAAIALGWTDAGEVARLEVPRTEGRHLLLLGETGSGKSSVLLRAARRAAELGAVVLLDPVGDTAERFVGLLPPGRRARARVVGPRVRGCGLNALAALAGTETGGPGDGPSATTASLVLALRQVRLARFPDSSFWGPRIEEHLGAALRAAAASPGATLVEALHLLESGRAGFDGRGEAGRRATARFDAWSRDRREDGEGARRLLGEIVEEPALRRLLCTSPPEWSLADLGAPGSISIIRGDAAECGEPVARSLLGVYLALVWAALLARPTRTKTFVLLDEIQWFAHEALADLVRLGRRYNTHVYAATQALASLPDAVQEPLRTNVADLLLFRGDPREAREWSRWLPEVGAERLQGSPKGRGVLLTGKGARVEWIRTVPPLPPEGPTRSSDGVPPGATRDTAGGPARSKPKRSAPTASPESGPTSAAEQPEWSALVEPDADGKGVLRLARLRALPGWGEARIRALGAELRRRGVLAGASGQGESRSWRLRSPARDRSDPARSPGRADGIGSLRP